jgi:hypothetical protein
MISPLIKEQLFMQQNCILFHACFKVKILKNIYKKSNEQGIYNIGKHHAD